VLIQNDLGEFVDQYDPNPDEMRARNYAGLIALDPRNLKSEAPKSRVNGARYVGTCPVCGRRIESAFRRKYCSNVCRGIAERKRRKARGGVSR